MAALETRFQAVSEGENAHSAQACEVYNRIIEADLHTDAELLGADPHKLKESAIYELAKAYVKSKNASELSRLVTRVHPFLQVVAKAKAGKIVMTLLEELGKIPNVVHEQIQLCLECIEWAKESKRKTLKQRIEARLAELYYQAKEFGKAMSLITPLITELKRMDEKMLLLEVELVESSVQHALRNVPKAKAALTAARTNANAIYCPPLLQATIDIQAGILQAEEKDYKTGYSYFYESFEGFSSLEHPRALHALKYMLLCKVMLAHPEEVQTVMGHKLALDYRENRHIEAMRAVAEAGIKRSLSDFETALKTFHNELKEDPVVSLHLASLYDSMLEKNLSRLVEPYSCVEINHIASLIKLPVDSVEAKLSKMILDKKCKGILDQGAGCLILFEDTPADKTFPASLEVISNMAKVVDSLYNKAKKI